MKEVKRLVPVVREIDGYNVEISFDEIFRYFSDNGNREYYSKENRVRGPVVCTLSAEQAGALITRLTESLVCLISWEDEE